MSRHEVLTGSGWKHLFNRTRRSHTKSRDRPFSGLSWTSEGIDAATKMARREIVGSARMLAIMQAIEPNRVWTISAIRGKIRRIRRKENM